MHPWEVSQGTGNLALKKDFSIKQKIPNLPTLLSSPVITHFVIFQTSIAFHFPILHKNIKLCNQFILKFCRQNKIL